MAKEEIKNSGNIVELTMNTVQAELKEAILDIDFILNMGEFPRSYLLLGKPGIGKSSMIRTIVEEMSIKLQQPIGFKELRLSNFTATDIIGLPMLRKDASGKQQTAYAENSLLPTDADPEYGILLLDELLSASDDVRKAALQLADISRGVGEYKLPKKWLIVAAANGEEDGGIFEGCEPALIDRFRAIRVVPDIVSWKRWAIKAGVHPTVLAYLSEHPDRMHNMGDEDDYALTKNITTLRGWTDLSTILRAREARHHNGAVGSLPESTVYASAAMNVGTKDATNFSVYYKFNSQLIDFNTVFNYDGKSPIQGDFQRAEVAYLTAQTLVNLTATMFKEDMLREDHKMGTFSKEVVKKVTNMCSWIVAVSEKRADLASMLLQDLAANVPAFTELVLRPTFGCPAFLDYAERMHCVLNGGQD